MPVKPTKVAVLLAAYNGMQWIEEQLCSILSQEDVDVSIHISVGPSNDGTESWCASFAAVYSNVVLLPSAGPFGGASRNFFRLMRDVDLSIYDYVAFADQDDIWHIDKLGRACRLLQQVGTDAYSSNVLAFWPDGHTRLLDKAQAQVEWDYLFEAAGPGCTYVFTQSLASAIKASMVANWQLLQGVSLHDWYCYAFARSHRYTWLIDREPTLHYRQHERNQVGANTGFGSKIARYKTIHNGWWFSQARLIAVLIGREQDPFVRGWQDLRRHQLLKLSLSANKCRRRGRDKLFFFIVCWLTALFGNKAQ